MGQYLKFLVALCCAIFLAACGNGAGGSGGGSSAGSSSPAFTFTPGTLVALADTGVSASIVVTARPNFTTSGSVFVFVTDTRGVISPTITVTPQVNGTYLVTLATSTTLAAGRYTGSLDVRVCPVANCAQQFPGSPQALPYDITVGTTTNLTPLSRMAGLVDWETYQANASHTGYVPGTFNAAQFSTRWRWATTDASVSLSPPVLANDMVYVTSSGYFAPVSRLHALREADGTKAWEYNFGSVFSANAPAVTGNAVYLATSGHSDTAMWSFAANDGTFRFRTPFSSQWEHYYAPTVAGGKVYTNGGSYGGLLSFDAVTGINSWFNSSLYQYDQWTPAVDGTYAYTNVGGVVSAIDTTTGVVAKTTSLAGFVWSGWSAFNVPVISGSGDLLVRNGNSWQYAPSSTLSLIQPAVSTMSWTVSGAFVTDPVVAGTTVFIANNSPLQLEARSLTTGALLWAWPLSGSTGSSFLGNLVATDSHIFVSTNLATYAISRTTHLPATWSYAKPGHKAISANGVLYISTLGSTGSSDAGLTAINLR